MTPAGIVVAGTIVEVTLKKLRKVLWRGTLAFCAVTYVVPDVYSTVAESKCQEWLERSVDPLYLNSEQLEAIGSEVSVLKVPLLPGGYSGLALPGVVALTDEATESTRLHEMVHQEQMRRDGKLRYGAKYALEWYRGRYSGCSPADAYQAISYEKQARATARSAVRGGDPETWETSEMLKWVDEEILAAINLGSSGTDPEGGWKCPDRDVSSCKKQGPVQRRGLTDGR